jgi:hypothetical protein
MSGDFGSYEEFWPFYVGEHASPWTRRIHAAGTLLGAGAAAAGLARGRGARSLLAFPLLGYGFAWFAHFVVEGNRPATFGHPLWSLRGDFQMLAMLLAGREGELTEMAERRAAG